MSENRYLNQEEARQVREFIDEAYPDADPIMRDLDLGILKSEGINTIETTNALLTQNTLEAQQRAQRPARIPNKLAQAIQNDDSMTDLDRVIFQEVRNQAPLSEDLGEGHLNATYDEIAQAQKVVKGQKERAAQERAQTARRFMGFKYRTVSGSQFDRGKRR